MSHLHARASGANSPDQPAAPARRNAVNWDEPTDVRLWIFTLRGEIDDAVAAGEDATRRPADRVLSRAEARRKLLTAEAQITSLLDSAELSLDNADEAHPGT